MILNQPDPTPLDLRFRLLGTYVRVHPLFWLFSILLGWNFTRNPKLSDNGLVELAIWVGCSFFSILLHEFGHVWMGKVFGSDGHIVLHSMGGLAIGSNALDRRWQRIFVSAAGPAIQLALFGVLLACVILRAFNDVPRWVAFALDILLIINLYWPILNLLPIWPLDGGQITREVCEGTAPRNGLIVSLWISLIVSGVLALNALAGMNGRKFIPYAPADMWIAILFALFAVGSWQALQAVQQTRERIYEDDALPWER